MILIEDGIKKWIKEIVNDSKLKSYDEHESEYTKMLSIVIPMIQKEIKKEKGNKAFIYKDSISLSKFTQEKLIETPCIISGEKGSEKLKELFFTHEKQDFIEKLPDKMKTLIMKPTKEQRDILYSDTTFLLIGGDYGTGKTHMLKLKAGIHAAQDTKNKVAYINLSSVRSNEPTCEQLRTFNVMHVIDKHDFKEHPNIDVYSADDLIDHSQHNEHDDCEFKPWNIFDLIDKFLEQKNHLNYTLICIDELPCPRSKEEIKQLKKIVCATLKVESEETTDEIIEKLGIKGYFLFRLIE